VVMLAGWTFLDFTGLIRAVLAAVDGRRRIRAVAARQRARFLRQVLEHCRAGC